MKKAIFLWALVLFLGIVAGKDAYAEAFVSNLLSGNELGSVHEYVKWLGSHVRYQNDERQGEWASPEETVGRGFGDCKDYAILNKHVLRTMGFQADIYVVTYSSMDKHAIVVFKMDGKYAMISNSQFYLSDASSWGDFEQYLFMQHGYLLPKIVF